MLDDELVNHLQQVSDVVGLYTATSLNFLSRPLRVVSKAFRLELLRAYITLLSSSLYFVSRIDDRSPSVLVPFPKLTFTRRASLLDVLRLVMVMYKLRDEATSMA